MATPPTSDPPDEDDMLPDEREVIGERSEDLYELDAEEYLTTDELAEKLGIDLE